jgi:peptidoglycan/LPS O-acetylase OafA/YrhL
MSSAVDTATTGVRLAWVDNLRIASIAGVVVVHTATAYVTDFADWYYHDELHPSTVGFVVFAVPALLGGVFGLGPLFWLAGWFSVGSLHRRGPARFALDRMVRLGVPLGVFVLVINPLADMIGNVRRVRRTFLDHLADTEFSVTWFVLVLLVGSLAYAGLRAVRPAPQHSRAPGTTALLAGAMLIVIASVLLWPVSSLLDEELMSVRFGAWPQGLILFALGVACAESRDASGGVTAALAPSDPGGRWWGWLTVAGAVAVVGLMASTGDEDINDVLHTMPWQGLAFATAYGLVSVSFTIWCLQWFGRRWTGDRPWTLKAGRSSYATYLLHPLVLTSVMVALSPIPVVAELKFLLVVAVGVPCCFAVGHAVTRLPGVRSVL